MECTVPSDWVITREQVGIETHVGGAAGVGVIAEADEFRPRDRRTEGYEACDVIAPDLGTENDDEVLFAPEFVAQRHP